MQGCYDAGLIGRIVEGRVDKVSRDWCGASIHDRSGYFASVGSQYKGKIEHTLLISGGGCDYILATERDHDEGSGLWIRTSDQSFGSAMIHTLARLSA